MEEVTSKREVNSNERYVMGLSRMIAGGRMASVFSLVSAIMLVVLFLGLISPAQVSAQTVFAVTSDNDLLRFEVSNPTIVVQEPIIGLRRNENINSIDFRPATGQLFALSSRSRLYTINPDTGQATQVGSDGAFRLRGAFFGFDFNPVPDRIRVVSDNEQNLRLNPDDGTLTARDGALAFADGDVNEGINPNVVGSAYSNSVAGATTTTLYGIDSNLDMLVIQDPPNDGVLSTVGSLGVNVGGPVGFDILTTGGGDTAFTALRTSSGVSSLFTIDLGTGRATRVGTINSGDLIRGLTVVLGPAVSPTPILSPTPDGSPSPTPDGSPTPSVSPTPDGSPTPSVSPTPDGSPTPSVSPTPDGSPTPPASPSPTSPNVPGSNGGCSIGGGTVQLGTAMANLLIPLVPAFAIGFRAIRRRKK